MAHPCHLPIARHASRRHRLAQRNHGAHPSVPVTAVREPPFTAMSWPDSLVGPRDGGEGPGVDGDVLAGRGGVARRPGRSRPGGLRWDRSVHRPQSLRGIPSTLMVPATAGLVMTRREPRWREGAGDRGRGSRAHADRLVGGLAVALHVAEVDGVLARGSSTQLRPQESAITPLTADLGGQGRAAW